MYMAVDVTEGTHQIEFYYCTPYLKKGAGLSGLGILSVIGIVIFRYRNGRKKQKRTELPYGRSPAEIRVKIPVRFPQTEEYEWQQPKMLPQILRNQVLCIPFFPIDIS